MHKLFSTTKEKFIHSQHFNMFILNHNHMYICRDKIDKNIYLGRSSSYNQLCCYNVPPNHRPVCSSITQQHFHHRAGHDSTRSKGKLAGSHVAKDTQLSQANMVGFIRPRLHNNTYPSQQTWDQAIGSWKRWLLS